jgi:hypothetical protein
LCPASGVCDTPAPTPTPTASPTAVPTAEPTVSPTVASHRGAHIIPNQPWGNLCAYKRAYC